MNRMARRTSVEVFKRYPKLSYEELRQRRVAAQMVDGVKALKRWGMLKK